MSKMAELAYDIEQLYIEGLDSRAIAEELNCPIELVLGALEAMNVEDVADQPHEVYSPYYGA
jgi:orotate phosphoribosyltransferase-like protein